MSKFTICGIERELTVGVLARIERASGMTWAEFGEEAKGGRVFIDQMVSMLAAAAEVTPASVEAQAAASPGWLQREYTAMLDAIAPMLRLVYGSVETEEGRSAGPTSPAV